MKCFALPCHINQKLDNHVSAFLENTLLVLLFVFLTSCATSEIKRPAQTTGKTKAEKAIPYLPPAPKFFGLSFDDLPSKLESRLIELGYERKIWELSAPYTKQIYTLADEEATFQKIEVLLCNHPAKIAALTIKGPDKDNFYEVVKERFGFGVSEWEIDERADRKHGKFSRQFAKNIFATLDSTQKGAEFSLVAEDIQSICQRALEKDIEQFKTNEQNAVKAARLRQRENF